MSMKETVVPKDKIVDETNIVAGKHHFTWRGDEYRKWTCQVELTNMSVKIYCSNQKSPGAFGWCDMTTFFTGSTPLVTSTLLMQTTEIRVSWWRLEWERSAANNYVRADLYQYGEDTQK